MSIISGVNNGNGNVQRPGQAVQQGRGLIPPALLRPALGRGEIVLRGIAAPAGFRIGTALKIPTFNSISDFPSVVIASEAAQLGVSPASLIETRIADFRRACAVVNAEAAKDPKNEMFLPLFTELIGHVTTIMSTDILCAKDAINKLLSTKKMQKMRSSPVTAHILGDAEKILCQALATKHNLGTNIIDAINQYDRGNLVIVGRCFSPLETKFIGFPAVIGVVRQDGNPGDHFAMVLGSENKCGLLGIDISQINTGDEVMIRGSELVVNPAVETAEAFHSFATGRFNTIEHLKTLRGSPIRIRGPITERSDCGFYVNITDTEDAERAEKESQDGSGLVRTEIFFMQNPDGSPRNMEPSIEEQVAFYNAVVSKLEGRRVVFRTVDISFNPISEDLAGDKVLPYLKMTDGGYFPQHSQGIGLCLDAKLPHHLVFERQMKALFISRAMRVMFPMVMHADQFSLAVKLANEVQQHLAAEGRTATSKLLFGAMIEHPQLIDSLKELNGNEDADFFSIGTNDLISSTTLTSRYSSEAAGITLMAAYDPTFLEHMFNISNILLKCQSKRKHVCICGDSVNDWRMLLIYLAMGYRNFSFRNAENADIGRRIASGVELTYLAALLENVMKLGSAEEVRSIVERFTREQIDHDRWNLKDMESILFDNEKP